MSVQSRVKSDKEHINLCDIFFCFSDALQLSDIVKDSDSDSEFDGIMNHDGMLPFARLLKMMTQRMNPFQKASPNQCICESLPY